MNKLNFLATTFAVIYLCRLFRRGRFLSGPYA